jgi:hypothetical protein
MDIRYGCPMFPLKLVMGEMGVFWDAGFHLIKLNKLVFNLNLKTWSCIKRLFKKISLLKDATDCNFHCFDILVSTMRKFDVKISCVLL